MSDAEDVGSREEYTSYNETPTKGERMFNAFRQEDPDLNEAIADLYSDLKGRESNTEEYTTAVEQIVKLNALKNKGIDPNTIITVVGNLVIGFAVLKYEGTGVITTKLWNFMSKL